MNSRLRGFFTLKLSNSYLPSCFLALSMFLNLSPLLNFFYFFSIAPKRQPDLLIVQGSHNVLMPTERHTWALHPMAKDHFWDQLAKGMVEAGSPFEYRSSDSSAEPQSFKTLFMDNKDGEGAIIPPRSVLKISRRMRYPSAPLIS